MSRAVRARRYPRSSSSRGAARSALLAVLAAALLGGACATSAPPAPPPTPEPVGPPPEDRPYLVHPLDGWELGVPPGVEEHLDAGHAAIEAADADAARAAVDAIAAADPSLQEFPPALVLASQADLLDRRAAAAQARLEPLIHDHAAYTALYLTLGRAADLAGDLVTAYGSFERASAASDLAYRRLAEMRPRLGEVLARRVDEALTRAGDAGDAEDTGDATDATARTALDEAAESLALLYLWLPGETVTLTSALDVAAATGSRGDELEVLRELVPRATEAPELDERALVERQAALELEVGDSKTGLDLFEELATEHPDDEILAERLAFAKFRWRVDQMPPRVAQVASSPRLQRGDMAVLLYWLVPRVRSAGGGQARIASDILDDSRREEIARVLNLGLMDMDATVHRFYPAREIRRGTAVESVLRVLRRYGGATCTPPAVGGEAAGAAGAAAGGAAAGGSEAVAPAAPLRACRAAVECGLLTAVEACRPEDGVTGSEAVDLIRRALAWMSGSGGAG